MNHDQQKQSIATLIRILQGEDTAQIIKDTGELLIKHPDHNLITVRIDTGQIFLRVPSGLDFSADSSTYSSEDIIFLTALFIKKHYPDEQR